MSNYTNFVQDFPSRCGEILGRFSKSAKRRNREVTLLLMASAAGFVMPYERLQKGGAVLQPEMDRELFAAVRETLDRLLDGTVGDSELFSGPDQSWSFGTLASAKGTPDDWREMDNPPPLVHSESVRTVLRCLRDMAS